MTDGPPSPVGDHDETGSIDLPERRIFAAMCRGAKFGAGIAASIIGSIVLLGIVILPFLPYIGDSDFGTA